MNSESSQITAFLKYLNENENTESHVFSKQRLRQSYSVFLKTTEEKNSASFATLQLRLKDEGYVISEGRDTLRFISGLQQASKEGENNNADSPVALNIPPRLFNSSLPEFAPHTKFFLVEAESFEDVKDSTSTGRLIIPSAHQNSLNEAFKSCEHVVLLVSVRFGNRLRGFCTMDGPVVNVDDLKNQLNIANLKADDRVCPVSWEKLGDYPIPDGIETGFEIDAQTGRNQCQAFYFERQSSIGEFKSPESGITDTHVYTEDQPKAKGVTLAPPLINAFSRCAEDNENEEEFRRRSMDKLAAAAHYDMPPRKTGVVVKFSQQKGYGFIRPDYDYIHGRQLPDIFVHRTSIVSSNKVPNLRVGQKTEYDVTLDPRTGKPHAVNVTGPNRVPLDEMKIPVPPIIERPPLYGHNARNVKKAWNGARRLIPQQINAAPIKQVVNQSGAPKENNQAWKNPVQRTNQWEAEKNGNRFLPKEMNMTVTIDNELPSNVSRYDPRQSTPAARSWTQPQFTNEYRGHYDAHRHGYKQQGNVRSMSSNDYNGRDWKVTSPAREVPNEYENYGRREYGWRYEQEVPQYDGEYRQMGYDYRYQRDYRPAQNW